MRKFWWSAPNSSNWLHFVTKYQSIGRFNHSPTAEEYRQNQGNYVFDVHFQFQCKNGTTIPKHMIEINKFTAHPYHNHLTIFRILSTYFSKFKEKKRKNNQVFIARSRHVNFRFLNIWFQPDHGFYGNDFVCIDNKFRIYCLPAYM